MLIPAALSHVRFTNGFWGDRVATNRKTTLPVQYDQCSRSGRLAAFELKWKPGDPNPPHNFWDSDIAKWIEASAYSLEAHADPDLHALVERAIETIAAAQQPDGYLNVHYTVVEPGKRWTDLKDGHELYCMGHLIEAAVAWFEATGSRSLLDVSERMSDHIASQFGTEKGKRRGYCGHPEVELALMKLARATGQQRHAKLAKYFVDERGKRPHFFDSEAAAKGQAISDAPTWTDVQKKYDYYSAHRPLREQADLGGHAVRALYLLAGAIDVAADTNDKALLKACRRLWKSATLRQMYITGGVGSRRRGETFTYDYDLPNETAYAETCASIALVFAAHRLLQIEPKGEYGDVIERALYNGIMSGVSLSGDRFRYANPLTVSGEALNPATEATLLAQRQEWFGCACCPPNLARLLASLGRYVYSTREAQDDPAIFVHLYAAGRLETTLAGSPVTITQKTDYPWKKTVRLRIDSPGATRFTLALRLPGWCLNPSLKINGKVTPLAKITRESYAYLKRKWMPGDRVVLALPMPIERMVTNSKSRNNIGKVALQRGPVVYCLEQIDNSAALHAITLPPAAKVRATFKPNLLGGVTLLTATAACQQARTSDPLYAPAARRMKKTKITAVPYCVWGNRKVGEMLVWSSAS